MEKKGKILQLRKRLDKTLALPHLANEESIKSLIKNQLRLSSSSHIEEGEIEELAEKRSKEVSGFVEMLRSASETEMKAKGRDLSHSDWKIKQDTEQLRVMYREGPHGTPFHTLLSEGLADGPIDVCLCVSWETTLYIKWWPQFNWPTFKIIKSSCLEQVRVGEEISLIRVKVPWPVSDREALLHYFEIEYLEEDLIFVLIKTISDTKEHVEAKNGLSTDAVPEVVRIDLVGGLVLQKADHCSSYFRVIANVDIKLDFVPPSLINFISRQLIGNGHKLFQKAVSTVATTDEDYQKALRKPMYARIREGVNSMNKAKACLVGLDEEKSNGILTVENIDKAAAGIQAVQEDTFVCEIVEEEAQHTTDSKSDVQNSQHTTNRNSKQQGSAEERAYISPEVDAALSILDNAISVLRKCGPSNILTDCSPVEKFSGSEAPSGDLEVESPTGISRINRENSRTVDANSLHTNPAIFGSETVDLSSFHGKPVEDGFTMTKPPFVESINKVCDEGSLEANGFHKKGPRSVKSKHSRKKWLCCLSNARLKIHAVLNMLYDIENPKANRGLGLTADIIDHCKLVLKFPEGTNSTWYNAQFKIFEPLDYKYDACEAILLWEQYRNMTTVLTREYLDVRPDGWLDYAAKRIAQLCADKCYNRSLCEEHLNLILPAKPPFHPRQFRTCAVVGNSGDLLKTEFGHEIDEHDAMFRDNEAPVNEKYARHVGLKRDFRLVVRGAARNMVTILNGSSEEVLIIKSVSHKDFNAMIKVIWIHSPMRAERKQDWSDVPNKELVRSAHAAVLRLKQRQTGDLGPFADCKVWGSVDQGGPISASPGAGELREMSNYNKWELLPIESLRKASQEHQCPLASSS